MFVGLSNGSIFYYKKRNMDSKLLVNKGKELDQVELTSPQAHKVNLLFTNKPPSLNVGICQKIDLYSDRWFECFDISKCR